MTAAANESAAAPEGLVREAEALLGAPDFLDRAVALMERLGLVGETINRRLILLAAVGGALEKPIHLVIKGASSGGKNNLAKTPCRLLPPEWVRVWSGLSEQALSYFDGGEIRGVLIIEEAEGAKHAEYQLRLAMSEGEVSRLTVGKEKGGSPSGRELRVLITASIITTTTQLSLHAENQTRVFDVEIDDSQTLTRDVLRLHGSKSAGLLALASDSDLEISREAFRQLQPREVVIPYAPALAEEFPAEMVRARRDFQRALRLIEVIALLHQRQRPSDGEDRVVATITDYELAYPILQAVLEPSMSGLKPKAFEIAELHDELAGDDEDSWVWRSDLQREASRQGVACPNTVHKWCRRLSELGFWEGEIRGGRWRHKKLRDPREEPVSLPRPEDLPITSQSATGRQEAKNDAGISAPPSRTGPRNGAGLRAPIGFAADLSPPGWEAGESPRDPRSNGSHPPNWEALGGAACAWCGELKAGCEFCLGEQPCSR